MKPIQLTMQAFGPYKYKETINFEDLQGNQLFVISGNTGAGKTTIFDGIAFALYGQASGEDRKEHKSLRSDFADDATHTQVELIFQVRDKKYRVLRQLSHVKKGRKTASGEDFAFMEILPDGSEVKACEKQKSKEISQKIEEIIGLTYDQFSQIVMLPQGEFRKMLTSDTDNKEVIFRKIFKTERFSEIAMQLEHKKKDAEKKRDEAKTVRDSYIDQITGALPERDSQLFTVLNSDSNIYQIVEGLEAEQTFYEQKLVEGEIAYNEAQSLYATKQQELTAIKQQNERLQKLDQKKLELAQKEQQKPAFDEKKREVEQAVEAQQMASVFQALQTTEQQHNQQRAKCEQLVVADEQAKQALKQATAQLQKEQQTESERKQLEHSIRELSQVEPLFATVQQLQQRLQLAITQHELAEQKLNNLTTQLATQDAQYEQLTLFQEQLDNEVSLLPDKLVEAQHLRQKLQLIERQEHVMTKIESSETVLQQRLQVQQLAEESYKTLEQGWLNNQAYELALLLVDGEPCPVCGSKEHENVHLEQHATVVNQEAIAAEKQIVDAASRQYFAAEAALKSAKAELIEVQQQLNTDGIEFANKALYSEQYTQLVSLIRELQTKNSQLSNTKEQRKALAEQTKQLKQQHELHSVQLHQQKVEIEKQKVILAEKQLQIPSEYENLAALQQAIEVKKSSYMALLQAFEQAQRVQDIAKTKATQVQEALHQTTELVEQLATKLVGQQQQWQQTLQNSPFETAQHFAAAVRTPEQIQVITQAYTRFSSELFAIQQFVQQEVEILQNVEFVNVVELEQQLHQLKTEYEQALQQVNATAANIKTCAQYTEKLALIAEKIVKLEEIANGILNLYKVLKGDNAKRISFERYVQIAYLEQITEAANIRLRHLSNGQYQLVSSDRQLKHGAKSGLSLDVYDSYTGQQRDVKTLSGGEKFNASLCLALGMADVIQSFQGNVRIDTMFIDEGFGSLDEESLLRAIDTLIDLQKSGRMIGVISHVAELKAAIPAVLEVMKLKAGYSTAKFVIK